MLLPNGYYYIQIILECVQEGNTIHKIDPIQRIWQVAVSFCILGQNHKRPYAQ